MMQEVETVASRRSENKNARKAKKLVFIYKADDMTKPIKISSDEVDVVTNIDFDAAGKYAYIIRSNEKEISIVDSKSGKVK